MLYNEYMKVLVPVPPDVELLVTTGAKVDFSTPFVRKTSVEDVKLPIAASLGFPPDKIFIYLHKFVGDTVSRGEVIAERKSVMSSKQYVSEHNGTIKEVNHYDGSVTVTVHKGESYEEACYFKGVVEECQGSAIVLKVSRGKLCRLRDSAPYFGGRVLFLENIHPQHITEEVVSDAVIVAPKLLSYDQSKLEALGARGFVLLQEPDDSSETPIAILNSQADYEELRRHAFSSCNIGPDSTTIYLYD